jgi:curved DNA-binding protein
VSVNAIVDPYVTLQVEKTASENVIRRAYRSLARKHHPDVGGDADVFKRVAFAYALLSDPVTRADFDRGMPADLLVSDATLADVLSADIFADPKLWRKGSWSNPLATRGHDVQAFLEVTFSEAFAGADVPFQTRREQPCPSCNPQSRVIISPATRCTLCQDGPAAGWMEEMRTLRVFVPAGVSSGDRVRLREEGGWGTPRGDLFVRVTVQDQDVFTVDGEDLRSRVYIPAHIASVGGAFPIPVPAGGAATVPIPEGAKSGTVLRLAGYGPVVRSGKRSGERGDLYLDLLVPPSSPSRSR